MNEWNRLADISTSTRRYLSKSDVQRMNIDCAAKMAKIFRARVRVGLEPGFEGYGNSHEDHGDRLGTGKKLPNVPEADPMAVELPAGDVPIQMQPRRSPPPRPSYESGQENLAVPSVTRSSPRTSQDRISPPGSSGNHSPAAPPRNPDTRLPNDDKFIVNNPTPSQYRSAAGADKIAIMSLDEYPRPKEPVLKQPQRMEPPPLPPKTPIQDGLGDRRPGGAGRGGIQLPYPMDDGPPPAVNMARKPEYNGR